MGYEIKKNGKTVRKVYFNDNIICVIVQNSLTELYLFHDTFYIGEKCETSEHVHIAIGIYRLKERFEKFREAVK